VSEPRLSATQQLVRRFVSGRRFGEREAHARARVPICPERGTQRSVWKARGTRRRAASRGKRILGSCTACGARAGLRVERRAR
jgi:hypothetical protein